MGSLLAALASYLDARANDGLWLMRMDDLDPPREVPGAATQILESLRAHGLHWDGDVLWQSSRHRAYREAIATLQAADLLYPCDCSRARIAELSAYDGHCRDRHSVPEPSAIRVKVPDNCQITFNDGLQGQIDTRLDRNPGDFVIRRKDGLFAYQLAVVVDDAFQGVNRIVRGADLLDSTPRQVYLQSCLALPTPVYSHIPVITDDQGRKFSKQSQAPALDNHAATGNLRTALKFLGQSPPPGRCTNPQQLLDFAAEHWTPLDIPHSPTIAYA